MDVPAVEVVAVMDVVVERPGAMAAMTVREVGEGLITPSLKINPRRCFRVDYEVGHLRGDVGMLSPQGVLGMACELVSGAFDYTGDRPFIAWMKGSHARLYCRALGGSLVMKHVRYRRADDCLVIFRREVFDSSPAVRLRAGAADGMSIRAMPPAADGLFGPA
jgi:hypothetical protein